MNKSERNVKLSSECVMLEGEVRAGT